jgi:aminomethyltransferase
MVEFAGFLMPVQYTSILKEHAAVREAAGVFDVSHMGQLALRGPTAARAAGHLLTRPVADLAAGRVRYALLCNATGGVVDDVTVYRRADDDVMLCVNAANIEKDRDWVASHLPDDVTLEDESDATGLVALQGPASAATLAAAGAPQADALKRFRFAALSVADRPALVSRTGYTGADGFEIYCNSAEVEVIFEGLLEAGEGRGVVPAGLGARDTLRLEAALPLYGHELDDETSPLEAGLGRFVALDSHDFIGRDAIRRRRDAGATRALAGFELVDRGVAREGYPVCEGGDTVGRVTSGAPSPTLGKSIGLAYVPPRLAEPGARFDVLARGRAMAARVVETPFVRGATAGRRR